MSIYKPGRMFKYYPLDERGSTPPAKPGEYRIRDYDGNMQYIGETCSLSRRMGEHIRSGKIQDGYSFEFQLADGRSTSRTRREHEREKIELYNPPLNQSHGGEGRIYYKNK